MRRHNQTRDKIVKTALELFIAYGIKKTSIEDVADRCGITRATVYRYFKDKEDLVRASFMCMAEDMHKTLEDMYAHENYDLRKLAGRIKSAVNKLPQGDIPAGVNELKLLYPDIFKEYRDARLFNIRKIYDHAFDTAKRESLAVPSGKNPDMMPAILAEATLYVTESPLVLSLGIPFKDIYASLIDLMLYGIMGRRTKRRPPTPFQ